MKIKVDLNNGVLKFCHTLTKGQQYKITENKGMFQLAIYNEPSWVVGISSLCEDEAHHVLFLDYDQTSFWVMIKDLERLAEQYSPFFIICSKEEEKEGVKVGNYQAISLDKLYPSEIIDIQRTTHCDGAYIGMPTRNMFRSWVLRTSGKGKRPAPKFACVVGNKNLDHPTSKAHYTWLRKFYNVPEIKYKNMDNSTKLFRNVYETLNRLK